MMKLYFNKNENEFNKIEIKQGGVTIFDGDLGNLAEVSDSAEFGREAKTVYQASYATTADIADAGNFIVIGYNLDSEGEKVIMGQCAVTLELNAGTRKMRDSLLNITAGEYDYSVAGFRINKNGKCF